MGSEDQIQQLMGMGFSREDVIPALRAAFGNTDRATEYLLNPSSMPAGPPVAGGQEAAPMDIAQGAADDEEGPAPLAADSNLYPLLTNPHFMQIRRLVQQRPGAS